MFNFSKLKKKPMTNDKEAVDATKILESDPTVDSEEEIETALSIPEEWNMANEDRYVYAFHNSQSPKLKINQISIYGMELTQLRNKSVIATGLLRNTVAKEIKFENATILLLDSDKQVLARKEFDLTDLGSIPPNSARPWKFVFSPDDLVKNAEIPAYDWSLAFEMKKKHQLDLDEAWEKSIAEETKSNLEEIVANAAPLKPGEVNFMGVKALQQEDRNVAVTILIRNGSTQNVTLQSLPLGLRDGSGEEVAKGSFQLDNLVIKANTSKPWTFIFPASMVTKENIDLSKWQAYPIQS